MIITNSIEKHLYSPTPSKLRHTVDRSIFTRLII
jgi:hypothetical protein